MKGSYTPEQWEVFKKEYVAFHQESKGLIKNFKKFFPMTDDEKKIIDRIVRRSNRFLIEVQTPERLCPVHQRSLKADLRAGAVRQDAENLCILQGDFPFWDGKKPCNDCGRCA